MNVPNEILHKPGKLTNEEYEIMKMHSYYSASMIKRAGGNKDLINIVKSHHERFDGKGYPDKLEGDEIPFLSRIITIADSFDAITTNRCYSGADDFMYALSEIKKYSGSQFDPDLANLFLKSIRTSRFIKKHENRKKDIKVMQMFVDSKGKMEVFAYERFDKIADHIIIDLEEHSIEEKDGKILRLDKNGNVLQEITEEKYKELKDRHKQVNKDENLER